ncbi:hypothetical protein K435DRAFT_803305 [Dendrothele bispora CBS 962.96]|uniref:Uncharacterized protein n=1 Tax=Dendrothele bispora (strain CBS 962.96) TaxID=1314807 RepID=A0A4S8LHW7_DENBC|nr:hypothetical protein K435DRAFT_803305 [Dendrothele bispora CBS 962.96]
MFSDLPESSTEKDEAEVVNTQRQRKPKPVLKLNRKIVDDDYDETEEEAEEKSEDEGEEGEEERERRRRRRRRRMESCFSKMSDDSPFSPGHEDDDIAEDGDCNKGIDAMDVDNLDAKELGDTSPIRNNTAAKYMVSRKRCKKTLKRFFFHTPKHLGSQLVPTFTCSYEDPTGVDARNEMPVTMVALVSTARIPKACIIFSPVYLNTAGPNQWFKKAKGLFQLWTLVLKYTDYSIRLNIMFFLNYGVITNILCQSRNWVVPDVSLSWINNTNTFIYFLLYVQHKSQPGPGQVRPEWSEWLKHLKGKLSLRSPKGQGIVEKDPEKQEQECKNAVFPFYI